MADIVLAANANWSTCNGGGPPGATDNIYLNGWTLTLDAGTCTCALIRACASNGSTATGGTVVAPTGTVINANLFAGTDVLLTLSANTSVTINGTATAGATALKHCVYLTSASAAVALAAAVGGSAAVCGCFVSNGTATIGTATGGSAVGAHGCYFNNGTATIGMTKGGSVVGASGVMQIGGTLTVNGTDLTGVGQPVGGGTLKIADGVRLQFQDADGNAKKFYGDSEMPAAADVWNGVSYGAADFTGTKRASSITNCTPANVRAKIVVDDVTGVYVKPPGGN